MRRKTSISLSTDILDQIGNYVAEGERSDFIEKALWKYVEYLKREERNRLDLQKINAAADYLNSEAKDSLEYQAQM